MKKYIPDTPKEIAFIAASVSRLGTALAGLSLLQDDKFWTLTAVTLAWIGNEVNQYITLHDQHTENSNPDHHDTSNNS
jgi:hypothetical protein